MADPLNVLALDDLRRVRPNAQIIPLISTEKAVTDFLNNAQTQVGGGIDAILKDVDVSESNWRRINRTKSTSTNWWKAARKARSSSWSTSCSSRPSKTGPATFTSNHSRNNSVSAIAWTACCMTRPPRPKGLQSAIASRIKIMANLDIAERRLPQDGRFRIKLAGREVDLRISVLPTVHGEKIVMRVLDKGNLNLNLEGLGLPPDDFEKFTNAINAPHGMILMTGPTGSGKTSTLYAVLAQLNTSDVNIVTVEDPVEYQMLGVNQVQVKPEIGLTFASGLRSILRQDPDVVMVGEIRDSETADIAVKAALTGHLVLSTLHTNDAPGSIGRLVDMGIEPFLVSSSLLLVCAQRLLRKICPHCKEAFNVPIDVTTRLGLSAEEVSSTTYYRGRGCSRCKDTGFLGRLPILEVLAVSNSLREQVLHDNSAKVLKELAIKEGLTTLRTAGLQKAKAGLTSLDEVLRVSGVEI
jgi:type IV pilus assembly protein PilB